LAATPFAGRRTLQRVWTERASVEKEHNRGDADPVAIGPMTDEELTDAWLAGEHFAHGISRDQHLRIAWVLMRRHGVADVEEQLVVGTRRACEVHGVPERFDAALTRRWARAIGDLVERDGLGDSAAAFIAAHP
jgi:hypothetical protein